MIIGAKIMFRENGHLQSYQSNIDAGYFTVKISKDINGKARTSTMLTAKGIRWVAKKLELDKLFLD
jgi:phage antirepressor YoqD-like protein